MVPELGWKPSLTNLQNFPKLWCPQLSLILLCFQGPGLASGPKSTNYPSLIRLVFFRLLTSLPTSFLGSSNASNQCVVSANSNIRQFPEGKKQPPGGKKINKLMYSRSLQLTFLHPFDHNAQPRDFDPNVVGPYRGAVPSGTRCTVWYKLGGVQLSLADPTLENFTRFKPEITGCDWFCKIRQIALACFFTV